MLSRNRETREGEFPGPSAVGSELTVLIRVWAFIFGVRLAKMARLALMNTKSEDLFEEFLMSNGVRFSRVEEVRERGAKRPDYLVEIGDLKIMFEVKQLGDDEDDERAQLTGGWSSTPGAQLRQRITRSKKQIQFGANQGIASVLLVYNNKIGRAHV